MLAPNDYPIFDDLAALIDEKLAKTGDDYNRACLKVIDNYIAKFKSGGRNSNLWNGASNFETDENFVCFDFQKLLANKNGLIRTASGHSKKKWKSSAARPTAALPPISSARRTASNVPLSETFSRTPFTRTTFTA